MLETLPQINAFAQFCRYPRQTLMHICVAARR